MEKIDKTLRSLFGLEGRVAIVTGAASGIGRETARLFADVGAKTVVADLNGAGAEVEAEAVRNAGGEAIAMQVDISDEPSVQRMVGKATETFGGLDILVNNAAYRPKADFMEMTVEQWDHMHHVNTRGTFLCMREAIRQMRSQGRGGAIVNVSTIGTIIPTITRNTHYDSSKGGINAMTRTAAYEFGPDGIRINAILPNAVDTPGSRASRASGATMRGPMAAGLARLPLGRMAAPIDMASVILFLASPASSYITGQLLAVDGGFTVS